MSEIRYAGYPSVVMYERPEAGKPKVPIQHLLWGDLAEIRSEPDPPQGWTHIYSRRTDGWVRTDELQPDAVLEMTWVDVGQGDGTFILAPDGRAIVVDAGAEDNLYRYLRWRFDDFQPARQFDTAVITHSDADHYAGFAPLFREPGIEVGRVVHNGIVERPGTERLGAHVPVEGTDDALVELVPDDATLDALLVANPPRATQYLELLRTARARGWAVRSISKDAAFLPGFDSGDVTIQVLSPITEPAPNGGPSLPYFDGDDGRAKNGNSIVLLIKIGELRILLGGDLNVPAETRLLAAVPDPAATYGADVAKSCHHGSADFSEAFIQAVRPIATVISSGDDEGYSHPRPDALGAIGVHSRGVRPLIFCTELARSAPEKVKSPAEQLAKLRKTVDAARKPLPGETPEQTEARFEKSLSEFVDRSVAVYGAIQLRSDGRRVVMAFKIEQPRSRSKKWDIYRLQREFVAELGHEDWVYCP